jgi:putative ABC transport system substrate-binding protein
MKRRAFVALLGSAALMPRGIGAQARNAIRIGYLSPSAPPDEALTSFTRGMRELGYEEGRNYELVARYAARDYGRFPALVQELLQARVDLVVTMGAATRAAPFAAQSVPVVFAFSGDPVDAGIVASFSHPGGNATGVSMLQLDLASKRVELLREIAPAVGRVAVLANPDHAGVGSELRVTREAAKNFGMELDVFEPSNDPSFASNLEALDQSPTDAVLTFPDALTFFHRGKIAAVAVRRRLPSIFGWSAYTRAGGLLSYGPVQADAVVRLAYFVDRIAKGAKPGELPVERPTKVELVIDLKTANTIGLAVPPNLVSRADEVIE